MRTPSYERSQVLWPLWVVLPACTIAVAMSLSAADPDELPWLLAVFTAVPVVLLLALGRLQVQLDGQALEWRFGFLGWPRWRVAMADIESVEVVRTGWVTGWGIHRGKDGWIYNASGFDAVRLTLRDRRVIHLGSAEARRLASHIQERLTRRR